MKIAYFDCFSGVSGDMALGALLDCGVPIEALRVGLSSLPVEDWTIEAHPVLQCGLHAVQVEIKHHGQTDEDEAAHHHHHHHGRSMRQIREIITQSTLSARVQADSLAIFERIAKAEAQIHHSTPDEVHFHEIGGLDSLLDICGVAWCLEYLEVDEVHCSALPSFSGWVDCAHGRLPLPAPATLEILQDIPLIPSGIEGELVTPTGASIVATLGQSFGAMPTMTPQQTGNGSGKKRFENRPNLLRVVLGENGSTASPGNGLHCETLNIVECNIDDMNPEFYDYVMERLFAAGALDVWMQAIQMKKNRPAVLLSALCDAPKRDKIIETLLRETTTLGVRTRETQRISLPRRSETVETPFGAVRVKIASWSQGDVERITPEWDDVARLARERNVAARAVYQAAQNTSI